MRREFEENEEKSKELEKNLDVQDEIDDETFRKILKEEFIEREKQIEEALFADEDCEDLVFTEEEVKDSYQELLRRFEKEKKESAEFSEELVPDEKMVRRMTAEKKSEAADVHGKMAADRDVILTENKKVLPVEILREELQKRRKKSEESDEYENPDPKIAKIRSESTGRGLHRLGKVVGMAVVAVACVFAASMTSEANRTYLVNSVRIWSGDDTKTVAFNDDNNEDVSLDEDKAIAKIEEQLGIELPKFYYRPYGMKFKSYEIDSHMFVARIEYQYKKDIVMFYIDKQGNKTATKTNSMSGDEKNIIIEQNDEIDIKIKKIKDNSDEIASYSAEWNNENVVYLFYGKIELEEIKKIVENMKF